MHSAEPVTESLYALDLHGAETYKLFLLFD